MYENTLSLFRNPKPISKWTHDELRMVIVFSHSDLPIGIINFFAPIFSPIRNNGYLIFNKLDANKRTIFPF